MRRKLSHPDLLWPLLRHNNYYYYGLDSTCEARFFVGALSSTMCSVLWSVAMISQTYTKKQKLLFAHIFECRISYKLAAAWHQASTTIQGKGELTVDHTRGPNKFYRNLANNLQMSRNAKKSRKFIYKLKTCWDTRYLRTRVFNERLHFYDRLLQFEHSFNTTLRPMGKYGHKKWTWLFAWTTINPFLGLWKSQLLHGVSQQAENGFFRTHLKNHLVSLVYK